MSESFLLVAQYGWQLTLVYNEKRKEKKYQAIEWTKVALEAERSNTQTEKKNERKKQKQFIVSPRTLTSWQSICSPLAASCCSLAPFSTSASRLSTIDALDMNRMPLWSIRTLTLTSWDSPAAFGFTSLTCQRPVNFNRKFTDLRNIRHLACLTRTNDRIGKGLRIRVGDLHVERLAPEQRQQSAERCSVECRKYFHFTALTTFAVPADVDRIILYVNDAEFACTHFRRQNGAL